MALPDNAIDLTRLPLPDRPAAAKEAPCPSSNPHFRPIETPSSPSQPTPFSTTAKLLAHHQYATDHILQSYELYIPPPPTENKALNPIWLIYLHGGAWRDPAIAATNSFLPTLHHILNPSLHPPSSAFCPNSPTSDNTAMTISGYASLSYRLSPHPSHPQNPLTTSPFELRQARHPDHIRDVLCGLRRLQRKHGFGGRYVLAGHSCGGTMGWWAGLGLGQQEQAGGDGTEEVKVEPPLAIVSVCAIYNLSRLVSKFEHVPAYREFVVGAFGEDERLWARVSPVTLLENRGREGDGGGRGGDGVKVAVLAHSRGDGLVDWSQVEEMERALKKQGEGEDVLVREKRGRQEECKSGIRFKVLELQGKHDEIWQDGREMARAIRLALRMVEKAEGQETWDTAWDLT